MKKSKSPRVTPELRKNHKSVDMNILNNSYSSKLAIPKMNALQTSRLVTRLSESNIQEDYEKQIDRKRGQLKAKNQRLQTTVQLLKLMSSNEMSVRCMQHNNVLTLYCVPEHKLLCVNCTYTQTRHRTHKVLPLKDSLHLISNDKVLLEEKLEKEMKQLDSSIKNAQNSINNLNKHLQLTLQALQKHYNKERSQLENKYQKAVEKAKKHFKKLIESSDTIKEHIKQFKIRVEDSLSEVGLGKYPFSGSSNNPIVQHLCASIFSDIAIYELDPITQRQLHRLNHFSHL